MTNPEVIRRPLESDLFGIPISSVTVDASSDVAPSLEQATQLGTHLLLLRVPAARLSTIQTIESFGGIFCDALLTLRKTISGQDLAHRGEGSDLILREASDSDAADIRALGKRAFTNYTGHWHADPRLDSTISDELYGRWAHDLAGSRGPDSRLLVAVSPETRGLAGFLGIRKVSVEGWTVPLTAANRNFQGLEVLTAMLRKAMAVVASQSGSILDYETQITNIPALRIVERAGFVAISSRLTFHLWLDT